MQGAAKFRVIKIGLRAGGIAAAAVLVAVFVRIGRRGNAFMALGGQGEGGWRRAIAPLSSSSDQAAADTPAAR